MPGTRAVLLHPSCCKQQISTFVLSPQEAFLSCLISLVLTMSFPSPHHAVLYLTQSGTPFFMFSRSCEFHSGSQPCSFPSPPSKDHAMSPSPTCSQPTGHKQETSVFLQDSFFFFQRWNTAETERGLWQPPSQSCALNWWGHQVYGLGFVHMTEPRREIPQGQSMSFVSSFIPKLDLLICHGRNSPLPGI